MFGEVGLHQQLAAGVADRRALLKPALQRGGHRQGVGGHHEAAHVDIAFAQLVLHEPARPQAFEHGERAEVFAFAAEAGAFADGALPQGVGVLALALGDGEVGKVVGQPFGLAGEVAAVALLAAVRAAGGGAHALGAGGEAIEQRVERRVEHAGDGAVEARAFKVERFLQALPGRAGQEAAAAEEGLAGLGQLGDVGGAVALLRQRGEGHRGPMHFGKPSSWAASWAWQGSSGVLAMLQRPAARRACPPRCRARSRAPPG